MLSVEAVTIVLYGHPQHSRTEVQGDRRFSGVRMRYCILESLLDHSEDTDLSEWWQLS
jgi:hypothetical protein